MRTAHALWRVLAGAALALGLGVGHAEDALLWFDNDRPSASAGQAVEMLSDAASHGLQPRDYGADALRGALTQAASSAAPDHAAIVRLEKALTAAMLRYLRDLHDGRVVPQQIQAGFAGRPSDRFDAAAVLRDAVASGRLADAVRQAAPHVPQYERLREALARYRVLADDPAWRTPLPPLPVPERGRPGKVEPGHAYAGLEQLARRLEALGDVGASDVAVASVYQGPIVDAVKSFQRRHGLSDDGVIGAATLHQLQVSPAVRLRQIELALERLRWTPLLHGPRMIVINIPEFVLRAYEVHDGRISVQLTMKVIVGKAMDMHTPLFDADLRFIEFSPYWNVPQSIARAEVVPLLRRSPTAWTHEGFEFVASDGRVEADLTASGLDAVLAGRQRIRQRPGPRNPLGDIKFVFPNNEQIYLHDTPATRLFARSRRDFSHGCIRVEQPVDLAKFVLQGMPQWTESRIQEAMAAGVSATLRLNAPTRVLIAYGTALVKDGRIFFFDDIYGQDRLLDAALRQTEQARQRVNRIPT
ncbi:MAG TPA: L,D-transpeptidase family protein [Burkholderiaceae bacterium]|nr:L,D-transpeptidase family protein [Burkholderiaceae bacterium]